VCDDLREKRVELFSNILPTVGWVHCLASHGSLVSAHLICALALRLKVKETCPIIPLHIVGKENSMINIHLCLFGSNPKWHCKSNHTLLVLFNNLLPLPNQISWSIFQISYRVGMQVTSVWRIRDFTLVEWHQLPKARNLVGNIGQPMSHLWEWTLSYRIPCLQSKSASSLVLPLKSRQGTMVKENKSKLGAYLEQPRPLDRHCAGHKHQPHQNSGIRQAPSTPSTNAGGFQKI
jgi:hypothetical protein